MFELPSSINNLLVVCCGRRLLVLDDHVDLGRGVDAIQITRDLRMRSKGTEPIQEEK